jgi:phage baseplate assembly protein W
MDKNIEYTDITPVFKDNTLKGYNTAEDEDAIKNSIRNLFVINRGEVPGKPWLGNNLNIFLFDNIGHFENEAIKSTFINTIELYEPRVQVVDLKVINELEYSRIIIDIFYRLLIGDKNTIKNYRFSLSQNNLSNITLRKLYNG